MRTHGERAATGRIKAAGAETDPRPRLHSLLVGLVLVAVAVAGFVDLRTDEYLHLGARGNDPGPGFLPEILMWILGIGGLVHALGVAGRARRLGGFAPSDEFVLRRLWLPALLILSIVLYQQAIEPLGYLGPSIAFALVWVPLIHWRSGRSFSRRHLVQLPLEALAIAVALYVLFRFGIRVPLP